MSEVRSAEPPEVQEAAGRPEIPRREDGRADLSGQSWIGVDLSGEDLSFANLRSANLSQANLASARLDGADLTDACLFGADLTGASLIKSRMSDADLGDCRAEGACFGGADLTGARLLGAHLDRASLTGANLTNVDARAARFHHVLFREAKLTDGDFARADMQHAELDCVDVTGASFVEADLRSARCRRIQGYRSANWVLCDVLDVNFCNAYLARREILDQNYLDEFRRQSGLHRVIYWIWWISSDCGRSISRWTAWIGAIAIGFAVLYTQVAVDYGDYPTSLSPFYFSVVTLTTLGYGDAVPASYAAEVVAMTEVIMGYVMLGGLLSIFASKMCRRAE